MNKYIDYKPAFDMIVPDYEIEDKEIITIVNELITRENDSSLQGNLKDTVGDIDSVMANLSFSVIDGIRSYFTTQSLGITDSNECYESRFVSDSRRVNSSDGVYLSTFVENSDTIYSCSRISNSRFIQYSNLIKNSNSIKSSKVIESCYNVTNSSFLYNSENVKDSAFSKNLKDCDNVLFCNNIENERFYIFNKPVNEGVWHYINKLMLTYSDNRVRRFLENTVADMNTTWEFTKLSDVEKFTFTNSFWKLLKLLSLDLTIEDKIVLTESVNNTRELE